MEPNAFAQTMAGYQPQQQQQAAPQPTQAPQQPQQHGNWFTHLLPTLGGIVGGIGGELINPFGGGIAGAALGSGLGKAGENASEGQSVTKDVLGNAVGGGVGQLTGGILGKIGGKLLGAAGGASSGLADNLVKGQFSKGALGGEDANALRTAGVTDARQIPQISSVITGPTGALSGGVKTALGQANTGVDITGLDKIAENAMAEQGLKPSSINSVGTNLSNSINNMVPGDVSKTVSKAGTPVYTYTPEALSNALPENVFAQTQKMEQLANQSYQKGVDKLTGQVTDADQYGQYKVYKQLANELEDRAFGTSSGNPLPLTDEAKSTIIGGLDPLKDLNPSVHGNLVNQVGNAQTIQELRPLQSLWVRANQAADQTARSADRTAGTSASQAVGNMPLAGAVAGGPHGLLAGMTAMALRSPSADRAAIPLVENGGSIMSKIGDSSLPGKLGAATGVTAGTANNIIQGETNPGSGTLSSMDPNAQTNMAPGQAAPGGLSRNDLITMALYSPNAFQALMPTDTQKQGLVNTNIAENALTGLGNAPGGGILSSIEGKLGLGSTGEYARKADTAAQEVAAALPGTDPNAIKRQLTDYMSGGANISEAITALLSRLHGATQAQQTPGSQLLGLNGGQQPQSIMSQVPAMAQ